MKEMNVQGPISVFAVWHTNNVLMNCVIIVIGPDNVLSPV